MTEEQLQAIRRRCEAATPGPWAAYNAGRGHYGVLAAGSGTVLMTQDRESARADIQFAAYARRDVPDLLSEVGRLQAQVAELKADNNHLHRRVAVLKGHLRTALGWWRRNAEAARDVAPHVEWMGDGEWEQYCAARAALESRG